LRLPCRRWRNTEARTADRRAAEDSPATQDSQDIQVFLRGAALRDPHRRLGLALNEMRG